MNVPAMAQQKLAEVDISALKDQVKDMFGIKAAAATTEEGSKKDQ